MKTYDHTWIIAEWERMGRPTRQTLDPSDGMWLDLLDDDYDFFGEAEYRIKCKPWINWEHVDDKFIAICTDKSGDTYLFTHKSDGLVRVAANFFTSFNQGTCDWGDSLVMRPIVKEEK